MNIQLVHLVIAGYFHWAEMFGSTKARKINCGEEMLFLEKLTGGGQAEDRW